MYFKKTLLMSTFSRLRIWSSVCLKISSISLCNLKDTGFSWNYSPSLLTIASTVSLLLGRHLISAMCLYSTGTMEFGISSLGLTDPNKASSCSSENRKYRGKKLLFFSRYSSNPLRIISRLALTLPICLNRLRLQLYPAVSSHSFLYKYAL